MRAALLPGPSIPLAPLEEASIALQSDRALQEAAPGVLAPWDFGHLVQFLSDRPVVTNGFGSYLDASSFAEAERAMLGSEEELTEWMDRRALGHLVAGAAVFLGRIDAPDGQPLFVRLSAGGGMVNPLFLQALPLAGTVIGGSGLPGYDVRHLEHLRPMFASSRKVGGVTEAVPVLWAFERVRGAEVQGVNRPGARVVARLAMSVHGTPVRWEGWTDADPDGRFSLRLPVPTGWRKNGLEMAAGYELLQDDHLLGHVAVPLDAVQLGSTIEVELEPDSPPPDPSLTR